MSAHSPRCPDGSECEDCHRDRPEVRRFGDRPHPAPVFMVAMPSLPSEIERELVHRSHSHARETAELRTEIATLQRHLEYAEARRCKHDPMNLFDGMKELKAQVSGLLSQVQEQGAEKTVLRRERDRLQAQLDVIAKHAVCGNCGCATDTEAMLLGERDEARAAYNALKIDCRRFTAERDAAEESAKQKHQQNVSLNAHLTAIDATLGRPTNFETTRSDMIRGLIADRDRFKRNWEQELSVNTDALNKELLRLRATLNTVAERTALDGKKCWCTVDPWWGDDTDAEHRPYCLAARELLS